MEHINSHNIIDKIQGGFRKGFSTTSVIAKLTDDISLQCSAMNKSQLTLAVFIDFKKAFDTLNHNILPKKLRKLGLSDDAIK